MRHSSRTTCLRHAVAWQRRTDRGDRVTNVLWRNATGAHVARYAYDAFGRVLAASGPLAEVFPHRFATKPRDPETGLDYYGYRFHSPDLCRWLNRDPLGENDSCHVYLFCRNEALFFFDKMGLQCTQLGIPTFIPNETWHLKKIEFDSISHEHIVTIYGMTPLWKRKGSVRCCCEGKVVTKTVYKTHSKSVPFDQHGESPIVGWDIRFQSTFDFDLPQNLAEAFSSIALNVLGNLTDGNFLITEEDKKRIQDGLKNSSPKGDDGGKWPEDPCNG